MSLPYAKNTAIPEQTVKFARAAFPKGNKYIIL